MKEIDIELIIPLLKGPAWIAMDEDEQWAIFYGDVPPKADEKDKIWYEPKISDGWEWFPEKFFKFRIKPAKDWTKSLRRIEG